MDKLYPSCRRLVKEQLSQAKYPQLPLESEMFRAKETELERDWESQQEACSFQAKISQQVGHAKVQEQIVRAVTVEIDTPPGDEDDDDDNDDDLPWQDLPAGGSCKGVYSGRSPTRPPWGPPIAPAHVMMMMIMMMMMMMMMMMILTFLGVGRR
jgi:hypothetical protein